MQDLGLEVQDWQPIGHRRNPMGIEIHLPRLWAASAQRHWKRFLPSCRCCVMFVCLFDPPSGKEQVATCSTSRSQRAMLSEEKQPSPKSWSETIVFRNPNSILCILSQLKRNLHWGQTLDGPNWPKRATGPTGPTGPQRAPDGQRANGPTTGPR